MVIVGLAITFIFALPHILTPFLLSGKPYLPLVYDQAPIFTADQLTWPAAEAREVMDGRFLPADPEIWEYKKGPSLTAQIPAIIIGLTGKLFGSINKAYLVLGCLLPPLVFLTLFSFVYLLTKENLVSCLTAAAVMTMTRPFQFIPPLNIKMAKALFGYLTNRFIEPVPVEFFRLPNPLLIFPFFMLTVIFIYLTVEKKQLKAALFGGILFGSLFYVYFYFWTFILSFLILLLGSSLIKKDKKRFRRLLVLAGIGLCLSCFYWFNFIKFQQLPGRIDILKRAGLEVGRIRNSVRTAQLVIFALIFSLAIKKKDNAFYFLLLGLLGGLLCLNIQLVTGYTFQSGHWMLRVLNPWLIIMSGFTFFRLFNKSRYYRLLASGILITILVVAFIIHLTYTQKTYSAYTLPPAKIAAFSWLDENTPEDSVVGSISIETNLLIPVYGHNNIFLPNGGVTLASDRELINRLYIIYKLFKVSPRYLEEILTGSKEREEKKYQNCLLDECLRNRSLEFLEKEGGWYLFHMKSAQWQSTPGNWQYRINLPEGERQLILAGYEDYLGSNQILPEKWRLDYLFYGPEEKKITHFDFSQYDFLRMAYSNDQVEIYQVKAENRQ